MEDYQYRMNQVVEALQFRRDNWEQMQAFIGESLGSGQDDVVAYYENAAIVGLRVPKEMNPDDYWVAHLNDYIVKMFKHPTDHFYVVPSYIFEALFSKCHENDFR
jgi:hypothetical protein